MTIEHWLLPDGVEDILPETASKIEQGRRILLDLFRSWGYEYIIPPKLEYLESLLTGTGRDLDLKTFKVIDQLSGRMMGLPADLTPQAARIDAHSLGQDAVTRLCYADFVLQSRPAHMLASRSPLKVGAELFGEPSLAGDVEIISLMIESLNQLGMTSVQLELGDVRFFRALMAETALPESVQTQFFDLVQKKAHDELAEMTQLHALPDALAELICALPMMAGDSQILEEGKDRFKNWPGLVAAIDDLAYLSELISARNQNVQVSFDLSELRGLHYHTGMVFSVFLRESGQSVARGGRYDNIGAVFGRARPATGFDIELLMISETIPTVPDARRVHVVAHADGNLQEQWRMIEERRASGDVVLEGEAIKASGDLELVWLAGQWQLREITSE
jgi:ATP phosphoribosyltransferase regulatory subunit